ncbi:MAG: outer membrane protein assembly factor BamA [Duodenibacillus sp.]|nr:outer membrane protein assembly factor BamA [Duodenibacillus sp.]
MTVKFLLKTTAAAVMAAFAVGTMASQVFTIRDIRVEGVQRTEPGTVFSHLPFRVGDEYSPELGSEAIHSLYGSGLFKDVDLAVDGDVLVVNLVERPAVATIETHGIKAFEKEGVEASLRSVGLAEGRIFDQSILDRADQELRRQYLSKGFYAVDVKTTTTPLERNRVRISIQVDEGTASSISQIRFVGNKLFDEDDLRDLMQLSERKWSSWYTRRDMYSREKLAADLESIRSFYLNQGYLDFKIDSVQVSVAPNKSDVYITINVTEGKQYKVKAVKLTGDMLGLDDEMKALLTIEPGQVYSAEVVNNIASAITDKFSTLGYAFCNVTPHPVTINDTDEVEIVFTVDPGRRAYVRNVKITGNTRTRDDVIRREVRQYEAAWFDSDKVKNSRDRIDRLGFFDSVTAEPVPVEGSRDQVDLEIAVKERPTGSISLGAGYSTSDGILLSAGFAQDNVFGSGKSFSAEVNTSSSQRTYAISVGEPYITPEGISRHWDIYDRKVDLDELEVTNVAYETIGAGLSFGLPVTEYDKIFLGARLEQTDVTLRGTRGDTSDASSPERYWNYVDEYGEKPKSALLTLGWSRDSRDNALAPTRGRYQRLNAEVALPALDTRYYRATYQMSQYIPLSKTWTMALNFQAGWGDTYGDKQYPFFKNFYAGGIGSVRGFETSSLGPRDTNGDNLGGNRQLTLSTELLMPLPGADRTLRGLLFFDAGYVWGYEGYMDAMGNHKYRQESLSFSDIRYSVGFGIAWISPLGPLKLSIAFPLNSKDGDDIQRFQFQIGTGF